ncbi:MAG: hypothetical protein E4G90_07320 [Gemmatimonadales bacterium]|nr:MAG: hypothetical protein E4G90_07320 [Gemmatimonadales bacterium]
MKYFHRTSASPASVISLANGYLGKVLTPTEESPRRRAFGGVLGVLTVTVMAEGGHYTLVTVETNQPGESEIDRLAKRFLGEVHSLADPVHVLRGAY